MTRPFALTESIFQGVADVADQHPARVAIEFEGAEFSYSWLIRESERIAIELTASGVRHGHRVGVLMERSPMLVASLLAVLRVGAAYVPLDPAYPRERLVFMAEDSQVTVILRDPKGAADAALDGILRVDPSEGGSAASEAILPPLDQLRANAWAYVMYTSGSTGRPKGVAVSQRSVLAMVGASVVLFGEPCFRISLASTSISFDPSVLEIFGALLCAGIVRLVRSVFEIEPADEGNQPTLIVGVPSLILAGLTHGSLNVQGATLALGGEQLLPAVVARFYAEGAARVYNVYGPTEDTTFSTAALISREDPRPAIGQSISGSSAYILDEQGESVEVDVEGEIFLAGEGLADGYLFRPGATAASFLPDPFSQRAGSRMYRTGDRGVLRSDGMIEYWGRVDAQVKVNGVRIELAEIENALLALPGVEQCATFVQEVGSGQRLVTYVVAPGLGNDSRAVRSNLRRSLPGHLVPSIVIFVAKIPRLPNGKVDTRTMAES